jgi:hypothetical protein
MPAFVQYNGVTIGEPLEVLDGGIEKTVVFDGPTYLYTRVRLHVMGVYNPKKVSYQLQGIAGNIFQPVAQPGQMGAVTDEALRHILSQPRQLLIYSINGNEVIGVPDVNPADPAGGRFACDAANGPFPTVHRVEPTGEKTFLVEFSFECAINEAYLYVSTPSVILSHRWKMSHTLNVDALCTRIIAGHAVFRSDRLAAINAKPDDFRAFLFHPIPTGFKRLPVEISVDEDNLAVDYRITDQQKMLCITQSGVSRIEGHYTQAQTSQGLEQSVWQFGSSLTRVADAAINTVGKGGVSKMKVGEASGLFGTISGEFGNTLRALPRRIHELSFTVWGIKGVSWNSLRGIAQALISSRISALQLNLGVSNYRVTDHYSEDEIAVTAACHLESGPTASTVAVGGGIIQSFIQDGASKGAALPQFDFGADDALMPFATLGTANVSQALNANADSARGAYLGSIVAAQLMTPNQVPPTPADPPNYTQLTPP